MPLFLGSPNCDPVNGVIPILVHVFPFRQPSKVNLWPGLSRDCRCIVAHLPNDYRPTEV